MIHAIIAREAQKKGEKLLGIYAEDLRNWLEISQPESDFYKDVFEGFEREDDAPDLETITRKKREFEEEMEHTLLSPDKFRSENPDLMDLIDAIYTKAIEYRQEENRIKFTQYLSLHLGALQGYDILRFKAEKERMKGLGI